MTIFNSFWDTILAIWQWFKIRTLQKQVAKSEDKILQLETEYELEKEIEKVRQDTDKEVKKIEEMTTAQEIADSFNKI